MKDENICFRSRNPFPYSQTTKIFLSWFVMLGGRGVCGKKLGEGTAFEGFSIQVKELNTPICQWLE